MNNNQFGLLATTVVAFSLGINLGFLIVAAFDASGPAGQGIPVYATISALLALLLGMNYHRTYKDIE